jgi:hypothetical protein
MDSHRTIPPDDEAAAETLHADVVLEATVLAIPVVGRDRVKAVLGAASRIYQWLEFTQQSTQGPRSYLEWRAQACSGSAYRAAVEAFESATSVCT